MSTKRRRNNLDIEADIIRVAQGGARKTQIVYQANLNFKIVKRYLSDLIQSGLLETTDTRYYPTDRARIFLEAYETLSSFRGLEG